VIADFNDANAGAVIPSMPWTRTGLAERERGHGGRRRAPPEGGEWCFRPNMHGISATAGDVIGRQSHGRSRRAGRRDRGVIDDGMLPTIEAHACDSLRAGVGKVRRDRRPAAARAAVGELPPTAGFQDEDRV